MKKNKKIKPKIKVNKLNTNPLFVNFLNWKGDKYSIEKILYGVMESFDRYEDKEIVNKKIANLNDDYLNNLSNFQKSFKKNILEFFNNNYTISDLFLKWLSNSYKYLEEKVDYYLNDEYRSISIKDSDGRWFEALICYNFIMSHNYFGSEVMKQCPICSSFFAHKGKYARYCSESCKELGIKKRRKNE